MEFKEWLDEMEGYGSRFERLLDEFEEVKDVQKLLRWLEAAYQVGQSRSSVEPQIYTLARKSNVKGIRDVDAIHSKYEL